MVQVKIIVKPPMIMIELDIIAVFLRAARMLFVVSSLYRK